VEHDEQGARLDCSADPLSGRRRGDQMKRREARAQQSSNKIPVVGVLWHAGSAEEEDVYPSVLVKAFNELGYIEGVGERPRLNLGLFSVW
jgi:hypothetical protein